MKRLVLSELAVQDLTAIWDYLLVEAGVEVADRVLDDLHRGVRAIAESPNIGHARADLTDRPARFYRVHPYFIVYESGAKAVRVARVLHAARDVRVVLENEPK